MIHAWLLLLLLVLLELLLNLHKLIVRPIFEEDHIPHWINFFQAFVHLLHLLVEVGVHCFFSSFEELLASSSSSSLELPLMSIFFNFLSCLHVSALCIGEEDDAFALMSFHSSWAITLLRTWFGVKVLRSFGVSEGSCEWIPNLQFGSHLRN